MSGGVANATMFDWLRYIRSVLAASPEAGALVAPASFTSPTSPGSPGPRLTSPTIRGVSCTRVEGPNMTLTTDTNEGKPWSTMDNDDLASDARVALNENTCRVSGEGHPF